MSERIRFALLVLVVAATATARAGGALGGIDHPPAAGPARLSHAQALTRREDRIALYARRLVGIPYTYGGTSPASGFDCSGFTRFVYAHFGITLPHYTVAQFDLGRRVARGRLQPGDLVFFDGLGHVGLYIGHGRFIHAPHTGTRVSVSTLAGWYAAEYDGARRIV